MKPQTPSHSDAKNLRLSRCPKLPTHLITSNYSFSNSSLPKQMVVTVGSFIVGIERLQAQLPHVRRLSLHILSHGAISSSDGLCCSFIVVCTGREKEEKAGRSQPLRRSAMKNLGFGYHWVPDGTLWLLQSQGRVQALNIFKPLLHHGMTAKASLQT